MGPSMLSHLNLAGLLVFYYLLAMSFLQVGGSPEEKTENR